MEDTRSFLPRRRLGAASGAGPVTVLLAVTCLLSLAAAATERFCGYGMPAFLGMLVNRCALAGLLPALTLVAIGGWLREAREDRRGLAGAALCVGCALLVPLGGRWLEGLAERRQVAALARVDQRAAPLIDALRAYTRDHGAAPRELSALVPGYLSRLPRTGLRGDQTLGYYPTQSRRHHYRLAGGGELCVWLQGDVRDAEVIGAERVPAAEFDPLVWRRDRSAAQASAFVKLLGSGLGRDSELSMLGLPDWRDAPPEGAWSLRAFAYIGRRGRAVLYVPFERYPQPSADGRARRLGRWWLYDC